MPTLKEIYMEKFPIKVDRKNTIKLIGFLKEYELRDDHPQAFNTPLLGVHLAHFFNKDQLHVFDIFGIDREEFEKASHQSPDINPKWHVTSDPFNLFCVWVIHNYMKDTSLSKSLKREGMMAMGMLLSYKFFTSLTNHYFPYKANENVMRYTIDHLSGKYLIKNPETGTWKLVMEKRVSDLTGPKSPHHTTLSHFMTVQNIMYFLSDIQTRLRDNIKNIHAEFKKNLDAKRGIQTDPMVQELQGEKAIKAILNSFDGILLEISNMALNYPTFTDSELIEIVVKLNKNLKPYIFKKLLMEFSNMALKQYREHNEDVVIPGESGRKIYIGYKAIIGAIIQKTYRRCLLKGTNIRSKMDVLVMTKNIYSNSRISDPGIADVKISVEKFIDAKLGIRRDQVKTSLKLGFVMYIILLSLRSY